MRSLLCIKANAEVGKWEMGEGESKGKDSDSEQWRGEEEAFGRV